MNEKEQFYTVEEIRNRLSISTLVFHSYRPIGKSALEELARYGIKRIELLQSPEQFDMANTKSMKYLGEDCQACGIELGAYHANHTHFSDLDTEAKRIARVDLCRRQIDTMLELGELLGGGHGVFRPKDGKGRGMVWGSHARVADATLIKCYEELARHIEGTEAIVAVENFSGEKMWVEDRIAFLDKIDHPQVGLILDVGHVRNLVGANPMTIPGGPTSVLKRCGKHLRHVHLHGFKDGVDHFPPLVEGDTIQWAELFRMFCDIGYPGYINFEPSGEPYHQNVLEAVTNIPERFGAL